MIEYTPKAARQVAALRAYYLDKDRPEALTKLDAALREAAGRIERDPGAGLPAPRPYPALARQGRVWIKVGRYWIAHSTTAPPVVVGVFYETADIPSRV